jgi:hypothetical protein
MNASLAVSVLALCALHASAQQAAQLAAQESAPATSAFSAEQLEQIVAPIALHPDSLLTQILMASTYPLEIVEAERWLAKNKGLKVPILEDELKKQDWDPSVKSLCAFPEVLQQMSTNLDWTQDLGDAFLGQKQELLDSVQRMRRKALEAGNLKTTEQQKVTQEGQIIVVESTDPEVVYVPSYSPTVVYGGWSYPYYYYPPMYVAPPPGYGFVAFSVGVAWGAAIWGDCDWGHGDVEIDIDRYNEFNRNTEINPQRNQIQERSGNKGKWQHDPQHRKGVNYRSPSTAQQYGGGPGASRVSRDQARGYDRGGTPGGAGARPAATSSTRDAGGRQPSAGTRDLGGQRSGGSATARTQDGRGSAFSGSRSSGFDRSASSRGASSRASASRSRGGGRGRR